MVLGKSTPTVAATQSKIGTSPISTAGGNSALCQSSNNSDIINCGQGNTQMSGGESSAGGGLTKADIIGIGVSSNLCFGCTDDMVMPFCALKSV